MWHRINKAKECSIAVAGTPMKIRKTETKSPAICQALTQPGLQGPD
jgi:hypothetical protein